MGENDKDSEGLFANFDGDNQNKATDKKLLDFSYSRMALYLDCPMKYKFRYVDKIKERPKSYFSFGTAIHHALEFLYSVKNPPFPTIQQVCDEFKKVWEEQSYLEKGYKSQIYADKDFLKGMQMLKDYYEYNKDKLIPAFLTEYSFLQEQDGLLLRAIADRIDYVGDGKILVIDYKTGKDVQRLPDQLYMYQKVAECDEKLREMICETYDISLSKTQISQMLYYHVPTNKEYFFGRAEDKEIGVFWEKVLSTADKINSQIFDPKPSEYTCRWCDYKHLCPAIKNAGKELSVNNADNTTLSDLIDRYGDLSEQINSLKKESDGICERMSQLKISDGVYKTKNYTAKINNKTTTKISQREEVLQLLNEYNLQSKALTLTLSGILSLLKDDTVNAEFKIKLNNLLIKESKTLIDTEKNIYEE